MFFYYANRQLRKFIHQKQKTRYSSQGFKKDCEKSLGLMPILSNLRFDSQSFYISEKFVTRYFSTLCAHICVGGVSQEIWKMCVTAGQHVHIVLLVDQGGAYLLVRLYHSM